MALAKIVMAASFRTWPDWRLANPKPSVG